jgi:hypothetical protein
LPNLFKEKARVLGISESFDLKQDVSYLVGTVMRKDLVLDALFVKNLKIGGNDATEKIIDGFYTLKRNDVSCIMIDGCILSMYNIVDYIHISSELNMPIICVTSKKGKDLQETFIKNNQLDKLELYRKLGPQRKISVLGYDYWVRFAGADEFEVKHILKSFVISGKTPEPLRVSKMIARTFLKYHEIKDESHPP